MNRPKSLLLIAALLSWVLSRWEGSVNPYYYDIVITIGINIVLAVSLNLVNGYTGQFSLGHAGFMAVGGYVSAAVTVAGVGVGGGDDAEIAVHAGQPTRRHIVLKNTDGGCS